MGTARRTLDWRVLLFSILVFSAAYVAWHLDRGWVPHDEGALAQSAERVLQGELPHRDYDELYTGGLTFLNAAAFRLFGTSLLSMRLVLFAAFLAWVPAVFYVASRLARPATAAAVTVLCVVWSLPNYPAPLPSWYNLFLTVFGIAALFRWLEDRRPRWLIAAGFIGGLSLLVKLPGLYFVAGALLFLVFEAHERSRAANGPDARPGRMYASFVTGCLAVFCAALALLVRQEPNPAALVQFVVPGTLVAGLLVRNEWTKQAGDSRARFITLARLVGPFLLGFAVPVALFLIPFAGSDAIGALVNGVFVLPTKRIGAAAFRLLPLSGMLALLPVFLIFACGRRVAGRITRNQVIGLSVVLAGYLVLTASDAFLYRIVWYAVRSAPPVLVLLGVVVLLKEQSADGESALLRSRTMLILSVTALFTLVQFPFSAPIYFCYVAPLVALLAIALLPHARPMASAVPAALIAFLIAFAVLRVNTSTLFTMGRFHEGYPRTASLGLARGGLDVALQQGEMYREAVTLLQRHARGGFTWASPDAPEIYFLSGLRNPTRTLFDFFDDDIGRTPRILTALERKGVTAIVLNAWPEFSPRVRGDFRAELERRYPFSEDVGKFRVRWR